MNPRKMMTVVGVAIALLAVPVMYAQQGHFNAEIGNGHWSAVEPPLSVAYGDTGYFNVEIGNGEWSAVEPPLSAAYTETGYFNAEIGNVPQPQPADWRQRGEVALGSAENDITVENTMYMVKAGVMPLTESLIDDYVPATLRLLAFSQYTEIVEGK